MSTVGPGSRVHLLGIRHHGPGSAATLGRALDELQPRQVLLEFPADTAGALALATTGSGGEGGRVEEGPAVDSTKEAAGGSSWISASPVSYTHLRAHET